MIGMGENLPIYKLVVTDDPEIGLDYIAFVDKPATGETFIAFREQEQAKVEFKAVNDEKRIVMGALMVADLLIPRIDKEGKPYGVVLDAENISKAMLKLSKSKKQSNVNLMHDAQQVVDGVYMIHSWPINKELGMPTPTGFNEVTDGSVFAMYYVENDSVWSDVKSGKFKGFSIEGILKQEPLLNPSDEEINRMLEALENSNL